MSEPHSTSRAGTRIDAGLLRSLDDLICPPQAGDAGLLARVRQRVMGALRAKSQVLHPTIRSDAGVWQPVSRGVERKLLWDAGDAMSCLLRLAPGASVESHRHAIDEECIVLEGSLRIGDELVLNAGDFHVGLRGVPHEQAHSESGALLFVRGAKKVEFV